MSEWRYTVPTNPVDVVGRRKLYGAIIDIFAVYDFEEALTEADVHLASPREPWYAVMKGLGVTVQTGGHLSTKDSWSNGRRFDVEMYRFSSPPSEAELKKRSTVFAKKASKAVENAG